MLSHRNFSWDLGCLPGSSQGQWDVLYCTIPGQSTEDWQRCSKFLRSPCRKVPFQQEQLTAKPHSNKPWPPASHSTFILQCIHYDTCLGLPSQSWNCGNTESRGMRLQVWPRTRTTQLATTWKAPESHWTVICSCKKCTWSACPCRSDEVKCGKVCKRQRTSPS